MKSYYEACFCVTGVIPFGVEYPDLYSGWWWVMCSCCVAVRCDLGPVDGVGAAAGDCAGFNVVVLAPLLHCGEFVFSNPACLRPLFSSFFFFQIILNVLILLLRPSGIHPPPAPLFRPWVSEHSWLSNLAAEERLSKFGRTQRDRWWSRGGRQKLFSSILLVKLDSADKHVGGHVVNS